MVSPEPQLVAVRELCMVSPEPRTPGDIILELVAVRELCMVSPEPQLVAVREYMYGVPGTPPGTPISGRQGIMYGVPGTKGIMYGVPGTRNPCPRNPLPR